MYIILYILNIKLFKYNFSTSTNSIEQNVSSSKQHNCAMFYNETYFI